MSLLTFGTHNPPTKQRLIGVPSQYALADTIVAAKCPDDEPAWVITWRCTTGFVIGRVNLTTEVFEQFTLPFRSLKTETRAVAIVYSPTEAATYLICTPNLTVFRLADADTEVELVGVSPGYGTYASRAVVDSTGKIWWGLAPYGDYLCSYDPNTGTFTNHGRATLTNTYCYPYIDSSDIIWCWLPFAETKRVVVYDSEHSEFVDTGLAIPSADTLSVYEGTDGKVYVTTSAGTYQYSYSGTTLTFVMLSGTQKYPYIQPDGTTYSWSDTESWHYQTINKIPPVGDPVEIATPYATNGTGIYAMHTGPDGQVYLSTATPNMLASIDPVTNALTFYGRATYFDGHTYAWVNYGDYLYQFSYGFAYCSKFNTDTGWLGWEVNPTNVGRISTTMYRPLGAILIGDDVYVAGWLSALLDAPHPLTKFSLLMETGEDFAPHESQLLHSIADTGSGVILIGTANTLGMDYDRSIEAIFWDTSTDAVLERVELGINYASAWSMCVIDGTAYIFGRAHSIPNDRLIVLDIATRTVTHELTVPGRLVLDGLRDDGNGNVLFTAENGLFVLDAATHEWTTIKIMRITVAGPVTNGKIFYGRDAAAYYVSYP